MPCEGVSNASKTTMVNGSQNIVRTSAVDLQMYPEHGPFDDGGVLALGTRDEAMLRLGLKVSHMLAYFVYFIFFPGTCERLKP